MAVWQTTIRLSPNNNHNRQSGKFSSGTRVLSEIIHASFLSATNPNDKQNEKNEKKKKKNHYYRRRAHFGGWGGCQMKDAL